MTQTPEERARIIAARYVSHSGMREQCEDEIEQAIRAAVAEERERAARIAESKAPVVAKRPAMVLLTRAIARAIREAPPPQEGT